MFIEEGAETILAESADPPLLTLGIARALRAVNAFVEEEPKNPRLEIEGLEDCFKDLGPDVDADEEEEREKDVAAVAAMDGW